MSNMGSTKLNRVDAIYDNDERKSWALYWRMSELLLSNILRLSNILWILYAQVQRPEKLTSF